MKHYMMQGAGDCYPACIASLLDLPEYSKLTAPIDAVNSELCKFMEKSDDYKDDFFDRVIAPWVASLGYYIFSVYTGNYEQAPDAVNGGFAHGPSEYVGIFSVSNERMRSFKVQHAVIGLGRFVREMERCRIDIVEILHDPCSLTRTYDRIEYVDILMPVNFRSAVRPEV